MKKFEPKETPAYVVTFSDILVLLPLMAFWGGSAWIAWQLICGSVYLGLISAIFWLPLAVMLSTTLHQRGSVRLSVSLSTTLLLLIVVVWICKAGVM